MRWFNQILEENLIFEKKHLKSIDRTCTIFFYNMKEYYVKNEDITIM
jgi:hypothetical protein